MCEHDNKLFFNRYVGYTLTGETETRGGRVAEF